MPLDVSLEFNLDVNELGRRISGKDCLVKKLGYVFDCAV